jgi:hypothetical protein
MVWSYGDDAAIDTKVVTPDLQSVISMAPRLPPFCNPLADTFIHDSKMVVADDPDLADSGAYGRLLYTDAMGRRPDYHRRCLHGIYC